MSATRSLSPNDINPPRDLIKIYRAQVRVILTVCIITVIGLILSIIAFYFPALSSSLNSSTQAIIAGLLVVHLVLHGFSARVERRLQLAILYLFIQIGLLFYIQTLAHSSILLLFLPPLLAEIAVVFEALWLAPVAIVLTYVLLLISLIGLLSPSLSFADLQPQLWAITQGMILALLGISTPLAAYFLLIRSRRQTGELLVTLDNAHRQLAVYAEQVEQLTVTAERARMARELHDTLAQGVAGLILQLEALDSQIKRGDGDTVAVTLVQIKDRARATLKESRQAIDDLRLMPSQTSMILNSIAEEINQFTSLTGISCTLNGPASLTLPTSTTEHTIRFVTEGLANIAKHAAASNVTVRVKVEAHQVVLEIQDDGAGFDLATIKQGHGHYGLLGLQERARLVGGTFEIDSAPNRGTTLRLSLPRPN